MEQKIQELTEKIYQEGVEKGEVKAKEIVADAEKKASAVMTDAKAQADKIIADAQKQAAELKRNTESELKSSGSQAVAAIKSQIVNLITSRVIDDASSKALSDPAVLKDFVSQVISNWKMSGGEAPALEVMLPEAKQNELNQCFHNAVNAELKFSPKIKSGFSIGPADGGFKISLTDEDFREFFKEYLRPRTRTYLFGE
jgi:V/A-type H+-transporting ATPase subunit E